MLRGLGADPRRPRVFSHTGPALWPASSNRSDTERPRKPACWRPIRREPKLIQAQGATDLHLRDLNSGVPRLTGEFRALGELTPLTFDNCFHWCLTRNYVWEPMESTESWVPSSRPTRRPLGAPVPGGNLRARSDGGTKRKRLLRGIAADRPRRPGDPRRMALDRNDDGFGGSARGPGTGGHAELRACGAGRPGPAAMPGGAPPTSRTVQGRAPIIATPAGLASGPVMTTTRRPRQVPGAWPASTTPARNAHAGPRTKSPDRKDPDSRAPLGAACEDPSAPRGPGLVQPGRRRRPIHKTSQQAIYRLNALFDSRTGQGRRTKTDDSTRLPDQ